MQDDVDGAKNSVAIGIRGCHRLTEQGDWDRADVEKPRPKLGAVDQQAWGQHIKVAR